MCLPQPLSLSNKGDFSSVVQRPPPSSFRSSKSLQLPRKSSKGPGSSRETLKHQAKSKAAPLPLPHNRLFTAHGRAAVPGRGGQRGAMDVFAAASDDSARVQSVAERSSGHDGAADSALELGNVVDSVPGTVADLAPPPLRQLLLFDLNGTLVQKEWARGKGHRFQLRPGAARSTYMSTVIHMPVPCQVCSATRSRAHAWPLCAEART